MIRKEQTKLWRGKQIFCQRIFLSNHASWVPLQHFRIPSGPSRGLGFPRLRYDLWNAISTEAAHIWNVKDVGYFSIQFSGTREPPFSTQLSSFVSFLLHTAAHSSKGVTERFPTSATTFSETKAGELRDEIDKLVVWNQHEVLLRIVSDFWSKLQVTDQPTPKSEETYYAYFTGFAHVPFAW